MCAHVHTPLPHYSWWKIFEVPLLPDQLASLTRGKLVSVKMWLICSRSKSSPALSLSSSQQTFWDFSSSSLQSWRPSVVTSHSRTTTAKTMPTLLFKTLCLWLQAFSHVWVQEDHPTHRISKKQWWVPTYFILAVTATSVTSADTPVWLERRITTVQTV